ncbi:TauD/TfdA dioxygenase family protein [Streptomyces sp. LN245]|uniref:TauD/TfdA dioxygenase family protein n=1 Tax=Streptomyces sp. LN245 TaxID=3112975 RepID=UPI00372125E5
MPVSIRKLTGRIGAVVEGVDLTAPPAESTLTALRDALDEHKALVFDHVGLDNSGQERVARWFGELTTAHPNVAAADGTTNVLAVDNRVTVAGEVPVGVDGRRSEQLVGDASHYTSVPAVAA